MLLAGKNPAHYLWEGEEVDIPGDALFDHHVTVPVVVEGDEIAYDGYPNRDSLPYMQTYGITAPRTFFRGTLRNQGWCQTLRKLAQLGMLDETPRAGMGGMTFAQFTASLLDSTGHLRADLAEHLDLAPDSFVLDNLAWLGLLSDEPLPPGVRSPIDVLTAAMLDRMRYAPGERDMLILKHIFEAEFPDRREQLTSTMVDFGIPYGDTSMARTVGLPAAIAVKLILTGQIALTGVQTPVVPEIYEPVLAELEALGIQFVEARSELVD